MRTATILTAAILAAAAPAHAESYGKLFGGATLGVDHDYNANLPVAGDVSGAYDTDLGYTVGGAYGLGLTRNIALEGEIAYRSNEIDGPGPFPAADEHINALSFMANGVVQGPGGVRGFTPYAGAGVGAVRLAAFDDSDLVSAYQLFGGVSRDFGGFSAGLEYRYLDAGEGRFGGPAAPALQSEYDSHGLNVTLTRRF